MESAAAIAQNLDQELKDKGITATFSTENGETTIGADPAIADPDEEIPGGWQFGDEPMPQGVSQLSLGIGGEAPTLSVLKFSGSTDLDGYELKKGSVHRYEIEVRIDGEGAKDSYDKHGNLKATTKEQAGTILGARRL